MSANSAPAGRPIFSMSRQRSNRGVQSRNEKRKIGIGGQEVHDHPHHADGDRDERRERSAGDTQRDAGAPAEDQHRREHDVEDDRRGLHHHAGTEVPGAAQRRPHRDQPELQRQRGNEPQQVLVGKLQRGRVGAHGLGVEHDASPSRRGRTSTPTTSERTCD